MRRPSRWSGSPRNSRPTPASAIVIAADLARPGAASSLASELDSLGLAVDVLVNNAGVGGQGRFDRTDPIRLGEMLQLNIVALTELTRLLSPGMVARRTGPAWSAGGLNCRIPAGPSDGCLLRDQGVCT